MDATDKSLRLNALNTDNTAVRGGFEGLGYFELCDRVYGKKAQAPVYTDLWNEVCVGLKDNLGSTAMNTWFSDVRIERAGPGLVMLSTTTDFKASILFKRYMAILEHLFTNAIGHTVHVEIEAR